MSPAWVRRGWRQLKIRNPVLACRHGDPRAAPPGVLSNLYRLPVDQRIRAAARDAVS